jgi:hypothetical protein
MNKFLPPGAEVSVYDNAAWVSACFVNIKGMRPSFLPQAFGMEFNYLIHRTRARLPYPDGKKRESVLVLEPNINRRVFSALGRLTAGVRFITRNIVLGETADSWIVSMNEGSNSNLFEAEIPKLSIGNYLPNISRFSSIQDADQFLLGVSYGGEWSAGCRNLRLLAETHDPWETSVGTCRTKNNAFLKSLCGEQREADHVITMTQIPHYFALSGFDVKC